MINITILAVNDYPDHLYLMKMILESVGYKVLMASDGRKAYDVLLRERVDIIISDVMMPEVSGIELCRLVRAHTALKSIPILLVSALRKDTESVVEGLQAGADDYLEHPFEPVALVARVARLVERKRAEDHIRKMNEELEVRVQERTAELEKANEELECEVEERRFIESALEKARDAALDAARLKSEFLANVSHEIRTPMHAVTGMAGLLLKTPLKPRQREYVETIIEGAQWLLNIINDVLDLSKIEAGKFYIEKTNFDLAEMVNGSIQMFTERAWAKGLELRSSIGEHVPTLLQGDPGRLRQVITNLLSNAVKFTEGGHVALRVAPAAMAESHVTLRFEISDTGIGVSPDSTRHIFLPFAQADGSDARVYGGTGLGLAISRQLVELMGGEIGVESEVGRGSTFWFTIKLGKQAADALTPRNSDFDGLGAFVINHDPVNRNELFAAGEGGQKVAPSATFAANGCAAKVATILVAEDNPASQRMVVYMLEEMGYEAVVVGDGGRALVEHARGRYALVLMDCQMPVLDGYATVSEIRRREGEGWHTPIVALTADAMKGTRERCLAAGMDDYLSKPFTTEQLFAVVGKWINAASDHPDSTASCGQDTASDENVTLDLRLLGKFGDPAAGGQDGRAIQLVETFLSDVRARRQSLREAYVLRDSERLRREAHALKGGAGLFGAMRLSKICDGIIELSKGGDHPAISQAFEEFDAELAQVTLKLEQWKFIE